MLFLKRKADKKQIMELVELGEVCNLKTGKTPPTKEEKYFNGNINWFNPSDLDKNKILVNSKRKITSLAFNDKKAVVFEKGSLLMTCIGEIGKVGITSEKCSSNQQITALIPSEKINVNFLFYCIKKLKPFLNDLANNAVVPILNNRILSSVKIPLFPLSEQKRIAHLLDKADKLRQLNKKLIEKYDELAQSIFLEMFGDPVTNPKGWEKVKLEKLFEITSSKRIFKKEYVEKGIPFYRTKEIVELSKGKEISSELFISLERYNEIISKFDIPQKGDILLSAVGTIGVMWTVDTNTPFYFKDGNLAWLKTSKVENLNPIFLKTMLEYLINFEKEKLAQGGSYNALTISKLKEFKTNFPPLSLQTKFANRVALIEQQKTNAEQALQKSEDLFNALLQKVFKN